jgi:hypothetical protein
MAITAQISSAEVTAQVTNRFVDQHFEARLINVPGTIYEPGFTVDATFLGFEAPLGTGGYERQFFNYIADDVSTYADDGVGLVSKATIFAHDASDESIDFSHAALVWSTGNVTTLTAVQTAPTSGVDGTYTNIPISTTNGVGVGLTVDLTITNSGAAASDFVISVAKAGYDYAVGEVLVISEDVLAGLGAVPVAAGPMGFAPATVYAASNAGQIFAVAQTASPVVLTAGNEAIFYWNLKQFGFYSEGS